MRLYKQIMLVCFWVMFPERDQTFEKSQMSRAQYRVNGQPLRYELKTRRI